MLDTLVTFNEKADFLTSVGGDRGANRFRPTYKKVFCAISRAPTDAGSELLKVAET